MTNTPAADRLEMRWLPVTDSAGRTRMEATWISAATVAPLTQRPATPHAA